MYFVGFSAQPITWFECYLSNRRLQVSIKNYQNSLMLLTSTAAYQLLFLICVNDMFQAVDCDLLLYGDDSCLVYHQWDVREIAETLNKNFSNICEWFVDRKLNIHLGEDKTKNILFRKKGNYRKKTIQVVDMVKYTLNNTTQLLILVKH